MKVFMERHREQLQDAAEMLIQFQAGLRGFISFSHACFVYYMNVKKHKDKVLEFLEKLSSGAGLSKGDPILVLLKRMRDLKGDRHKITSEEKIAFIIMVWNAFLTGDEIKVLRWRSQVDQFPRFANVEE